MDNPPAISKPKRKYNRLVRDIDRALGLARLTGLQSFLVQRAREASWTASTVESKGDDGHPIPFRLNLSRLSRIAECSRDNLTNAHRDLIARRILVPAAPGYFLINKDYRAWLRPDGSPALSEAMLADVESARLTRSFRRSSVGQWASLAPQGVVSALHRPVVQTLRSAEVSTLHPLPCGHYTPCSADTTSAYRGTGASERPSGDLSETREQDARDSSLDSTKSPTPPMPSVHSDVTAADDYEPVNAPSSPAPMATSRPAPILNRPAAAEPVANTPAEVERAAAYARSKWGEAAEVQARSDCEDFWAADVLEAMKKATSAGASGYAYAAKVVRSWWAETGGKPKATPASKLRTPMPPEHRRDAPLTGEELETHRYMMAKREEFRRKKIERFDASRGILPLKRTI